MEQNKIDNTEIEENETEEIEIVNLESVNFPCPGCGADLKFSPNESALVCPYCKHEVSIESTSEEPDEYSIAEAEEKADHDWGIEQRTVKCNNCGAAIMLEKNIAALNCPFCNSTQITEETDQLAIKPETLIPFAIAKEKVDKLFVNWISKKLFAPKDIKRGLNIKDLKGIYMPHWTYDSDSSTVYVAKKGTYYYTTHTRTVNGKTVTTRVRHTSWRTVRGVYSNFYNDVIVNGSNTVDKKITKKLGTFHISELVAYKPEYLSGFITERYSVNLNDGWQIAKKMIDDAIYKGIRKQVGGDEFKLVSRTSNYGDVKYKHFLLPMWVSYFRYKKKTFHFAVNGQTGSVNGSYPKSAIKIAIACLLGIVITVGIFIIIRQIY